MAKCKNDPIIEDEAKEEQVESAKTVEMEVAHEYGKEDKNDKMEVVVNIVTKLSKQKQVLEQKQTSEDLEVDECGNYSIAEQSTDGVPEGASNTETESSEEDNDASHFLEDVGEDKSDDKNKMHIDEPDPKIYLSRAESEDPDDSETIDETPNRTTDDLNEYTEESSNDYEVPNCSLGEVSLNFGEAASEEQRKRLVSQSDSNVDIRNLILGRAFVLCFCDNFDCECEGEVLFDESLKGQVGVIENLYIDPRPESEEDLEPKLSLTKAGWRAEEPNTIKFKLGGVAKPGVISSSGEVVLTASRVVEVVKGRKELSTVIMGKLGMSLKLGKG